MELIVIMIVKVIGERVRIGCIFIKIYVFVVIINVFFRIVVGIGFFMVLFN